MTAKMVARTTTRAAVLGRRPRVPMPRRPPETHITAVPWLLDAERRASRPAPVHDVLGGDFMAADSLRRSPLNDRHRQLGATMTEFGGWDMPLDYGSVVAEHQAVREGVGVFDLSHLGTVMITGSGAE